MTGTVLFLGASGKVARHAAPVFEAAGWRVRSYDRTKGDMNRQAEGVDVIVNGLNPPNYHDWANIIPAITRQVIAAARHSGAAVIIPGNVYVYGKQPGVWTEDTPRLASTRKGRIRADMEQAYADAGVRTIILRAGDFISAEPDDNDVMNIMLLRSLDRGKITALGDPDAIHAFGYLPDWAQAARLLAERREALDRFTVLNLGGANFTIRDLQTVQRQRAGTDLRLARFPWPLIRLTSPAWELARELLEMKYLWDMPHELSQARLCDLLPEYRPTDLRKIMLAGR